MGTERENPYEKTAGHIKPLRGDLTLILLPEREKVQTNTLYPLSEARADVNKDKS